ncbi:PML-RARA-regulated adapter molecule 1 isoform 3-T3 [Macrochelys suwanniensis]
MERGREASAWGQKMEGDRVKHLRAKFQGNGQKSPGMSNRQGSQLAVSLAKEETDALKPGSERDQSAKLPQTRRMGLKNAPLSQDDIPGLGPLCEDPAWVANSKDRNVMESSPHSAILQTGIREARPEQKGTRWNSNLPERSQTQQTWPLIKRGHRKPNSAVSSPVRLAPQAAPAPRVPSSAGEVLRCDQEQIYDDVEVVGPIGKGKGHPLSPASRLPASPHSGAGTKLILDRFPPPPTEPRKPQISELSGKRVKNLKQCKKEEQADKEFRKKFKFEGEIRALTRMMVDPNVAEKKGGGKNLPLRRGEILDVIQLTSPERILCRNDQWKYGYIPRVALLQLDTDIYDDVAFCGRYPNEPHFPSPTPDSEVTVGLSACNLQ